VKPTAMQMRKALEERLAAIRSKVPARLLRAGDLVEYLAVYGGWRTGRVLRVQPRANRIVVGPPTRDDLPRGHKDLADAMRVHVARVELPDGRTVDRVTHREPRGTIVLAQQITGVFQGPPEAGRAIVRPGTDAWIQFTAARAAGATGDGKPDNRTVAGTGIGAMEGHVQAPADAQSAAPPNPAAVLQHELRDALAAQGGTT